jgi:hypothetical protein
MDELAETQAADLKRERRRRARKKRKENKRKRMAMDDNDEDMKPDFTNPHGARPTYTFKQPPNRPPGRLNFNFQLIKDRKLMRICSHGKRTTLTTKILKKIKKQIAY